MPPFQPHKNTVNGLGRRLRSQEICLICVIVTPCTPQCWDSRREMCWLCAMNTAENEGHRCTRLTLRLPPWAHKTCALCEQRYNVPLSNLNEKSADYESSEFTKRLVYFPWIQGFFQPGTTEIWLPPMKLIFSHQPVAQFMSVLIKNPYYHEFWSVLSDFGLVSKAKMRALKRVWEHPIFRHLRWPPTTFTVFTYIFHH